MGIFKDIATSPLGDVTIGAFEALENKVLKIKTTIERS